MNKMKRYFQFFLIVLAAGAIFPLIYLRASYQETILTVFGITIDQLNGIFTFIGIVFMVGFLPSGWLADRFSAKKLLFVSLFICGLAGLWFAQIPSYHMVLVIFAIWGVFSVFTFWAAHLKIVKLISQEGEEGRFFGILEGGRGVVEAILATVALFIFSNLLGESTYVEDKTVALQGVIYMYSWTMIVVSFFILIFVKELETAPVSKSKNEAKQKFDIQVFKKVLANKFVWYIGVILCMAYGLAWTIHYLGGFLQTNINIDAVTVGQVIMVMLWMRPIGGIVGGFLGDKFGRSNVLMVTLGISSTLLIILASSPVNLPYMYFKVLVVLTGLIIYIVRGLYWSLLGDCKIDSAILGLSIGFISLIGYLPDLYIPKLNSWLISTLGSEVGQNAHFIISAVFGVIGIGVIMSFKRVIKKENDAIEKTVNLVKNLKKA